MKPTIVLDNAKVFSGNCLDVLPTLADNSVDSVVCDPPYELGFMGKSWDASGIAYNVNVWRECLRVLKPGGHLLAFGGSRTWHRLAVAIEDAGFEMRDSIAWIYGSGFPKSHNISKAIDKTQGADVKIGKAFKVAGEYGGRDLRDPETQGESRDEMRHSAITDDAKKWDGWGTALKPAFEPIVVARKPLIDTVAENVLQYGTGGINIDASRIGTEQRETWSAGGVNYKVSNPEPWQETKHIVQGRWPANVMFGHTEDCVQIGTSQEKYSINKLENWSGFGQIERPDYESGEQVVSNPVFECVDGCPVKKLDGQSDDSSRFFYVAKANKKDRNEGLDELPIKRPDTRTSTGMGTFEEKGVQPQRNHHPTVKPTQLMKYLVKLVTPPNGIVLDPFAGSGSTGKAAILEGFGFIGIELTEEYLPIIAGRLEFASQERKKMDGELFADL